MFRTILLSAGLLFASAAHADTKEELKVQKVEVKYHKKVAKKIGKLADKWEKTDEKGKDTSKLESDLKEYYKSELEWLRKKGVPTKKNEKFVHPTEKDGLEITEDEAEKMEHLRDLIVDLKSGEIKSSKKKGAALQEFADILDARYNRKAKKYDKNKASS